MRRGLPVVIAVISASLASAGLAQTADPIPAVAVAASGETVPVGTANQDAADDPAIWRNPRSPARSLIVATDKRAGLYVYGLDGAVRHFEPAGRLNNVDLLDLGRRGIVVVASDRNDKAHAVLRLYRLDRRSGALTALGNVSGGAGEAYGVCLMRQGHGLTAFSVLKHGAIHQININLSGAAPAAATVRSFQLDTQTEGCVADARTGTLYVGEEDRGIWAFSISRGAGATGAIPPGRLVAAADGRQLVADVEGLALAPRGRRGGWLIASSQGDNAYALFRLPGMEPAGRFRIAAGRFGATEETDGIAFHPGGFGAAYPQGLFIAQDGHNAPAAQNFKLVSWRAVQQAVTAELRKRVP